MSLITIEVFKAKQYHERPVKLIKAYTNTSYWYNTNIPILINDLPRGKSNGLYIRIKKNAEYVFTKFIPLQEFKNLEFGTYDRVKDIVLSHIFNIPQKTLFDITLNPTRDNQIFDMLDLENECMLMSEDKKSYKDIDPKIETNTEEQEEAKKLSEERQHELELILEQIEEANELDQFPIFNPTPDFDLKNDELYSTDPVIVKLNEILDHTNDRFKKFYNNYKFGKMLLDHVREHGVEEAEMLLDMAGKTRHTLHDKKLKVQSDILERRKELAISDDMAKLKATETDD